MVTFHTNHGDIVIKTFDDKAPETVKTSGLLPRRFLQQHYFPPCDQRLYDPGGGFELGMRQKETKEAIKNEANNGLKTPVVRWQWPVLRRHILQPHSSSST